MGPQGNVPQFKVECAWSHAASDDPIVHPGRPGHSHRHDFFGNTATGRDLHGGAIWSAATPAARTGSTRRPTGRRRSTGTARPVVPTGSVAYYRPAPGVDPADAAGLPRRSRHDLGRRRRRRAAATGRRGLALRRVTGPLGRAARLPAHRSPRRPHRLPRLLGRRAPRQRRPSSTRRAQRRRADAPTTIPCASRSSSSRCTTRSRATPTGVALASGWHARRARRLRQRVGPSRPGAGGAGVPQPVQGLRRGVEPGNRMTGWGRSCPPPTGQISEGQSRSSFSRTLSTASSILSRASSTKSFTLPSI